MTPLAYAASRRPTGPPVLVTFLPGFWLLVPGALGLIGVTESIEQVRAAGISSFYATLGAIASVALGVLCGSALDQSARGLRTASRRLR